jgi:hypothetical protein
MNKNFRIKNYETGISWQRTVAEIEELLVAIGAEAILKDYYGDGRIAALSFKYQKRGYRLPANSVKVAELLKSYPGFKRAMQQHREEQAERIAWRNIRDWFEAQVALIQTSQVEVAQIMLPYMWDGRETLYEKLKDRQFMLEPGSD